MDKYHLALIISPDLTEESVKKLVGEIEELVKKEKGVWEKAEDWGRRKLAYNIKGKVEGYYYFIIFSADPKLIIELGKRLKLKEEILRILCEKI